MTVKEYIDEAGIHRAFNTINKVKIYFENNNETYDFNMANTALYLCGYYDDKAICYGVGCSHCRFHDGIYHCGKKVRNYVLKKIREYLSQRHQRDSMESML